MQNKLFFLALALLSLCAFSQKLIAQEIRMDENGRAIIVNEDGTITPWGAQIQEDGNSNSYPVLKVEIDPLPGDIDVTTEDLRRIAERKAQLAKEAARIAEERAEEARLQRIALEKEYKVAANGDSNEELLRRIEERLKSAREMETETRQEATLAHNEASAAEQITERGTYVEDYLREQELKKKQVQQYEDVDILAGDSYENIILDDNYAPFAHTHQVIQAPPAERCAVAYKGINEKGRYQKDLRKEILFTFTDERLRPYLEDQEYLTCKASLTQLGGYRLLSLDLTFAYPNASEAYGFIEKGSYLMVKMLNNQFITLYSGEMVKGTYDTTTKLLTYRVHYPISQGQFNSLRRNEVNSVIVSWSSGYEEYQIYDPGFFIDQVNCLEQD